MGERKVLNKYYPPDFDPAKIPRRKQPKNLQMKVRMMLPMSIRCSTCGNYIYKGTKFNCRKEDVLGETYLGILIFRFYFKCTKCSAELIMKTDPQNSDYIMESGASRNFEPWRAKDEARDEEQKKRDEEELGDAMKVLENRAIDSKQEMDIMAALDEMKSMRSRQASIDTNLMLAALKKTAPQSSTDLPEEDEELIKRIFFRDPSSLVKRIEDSDEDRNSSDNGSDGGRDGGTDGGIGGSESNKGKDFGVNHTIQSMEVGVNGALLSTGFEENKISKRQKFDIDVGVQKIQSGEVLDQGKDIAKVEDERKRKASLQVKVAPKTSKLMIVAKPKSTGTVLKEIGVKGSTIITVKEIGQKEIQKGGEGDSQIQGGKVANSVMGLTGLSAYGSSDDSEEG